MTAARILALGGTLASALTMFGGLLGWTTMVGMAGAVMLAANVVVLAGVGRRLEREATAHVKQVQQERLDAARALCGCWVCQLGWGP